MSHIVVNEEQAKIITASSSNVEVHDEQGNILGRVLAFHPTSTEIADIKRDIASDQRRYTTAEVIEHLHSLE